MKKVQDDYRLGNNSVKLFLETKYKDSAYILDCTKQYHAVIVAPAIPGVYTFIDYGIRGYSFDKSSDNYKIIGGINTHDIVLNKFIGITTLFGATSFGCRHDEVSLLDFAEFFLCWRLPILQIKSDRGLIFQSTKGSL